MSLTVEHRIIDVFGGAHGGVGIQQHRAQYRLFCFLGPGWSSLLVRVTRCRCGRLHGDWKVGHGRRRSVTGIGAFRCVARGVQNAASQLDIVPRRAFPRLVPQHGGGMVGDDERNAVE